MPSLESGDRLGRYEIADPLGKGGMGEVYRARDSKLGRQVALKVLPDAFAADPERLARFEREARAASALNHPHICTIHDVGDHHGVPYLVMELLEGQSLRDRIDAGALSTPQTLEILIGVADAVAAAHDAGIIHRDIKPANIFITERGVAKVLDFGLVRIDDPSNLAGEGVDLEAPTLHSPDLTRPGSALGTVSYMSPEQVLGKRVDGKTDVFSFGVVMYELLTGTTPFSGKTSGAVFDQIVHSAPASPVKLNPDLPREFERIVNQCLQKKPEDRSTAQQIGADLEQLRRAITGDRRPTESRLRRSVQRPAFWLGAAAMITVAAVIGVRWKDHAKQVRWAHDVALPELREMAADSRTHALAGAALASRAAPFLDRDPEFARLKSVFLTTTAIGSDPPGAEVWIRPYLEPEAPWLSLGTTPIEGVELPKTYLRWRLELAGHDAILDAGIPMGWQSDKGGVSPIDMFWTLSPVGAMPPDMIRIPGNDQVPAFLVDRYEVTNKQYKEFVDAGGYDRREFWNHDFVREARSLDFESAIALLVDQTGRPGPGGWEAGDYPDGADRQPVTGVSWYEASAFARFSGKSLPTIHHWERARGIFVGLSRWSFTGLLYSLANFGGDGPLPVGSSHAMTPLGALDMAGNVREWCFNPAPSGRCIRGGAWNDPTYMFSNITQADAFDRSGKNGFRCVVYEDPDRVPVELFDGLSLEPARDLLSETPVSDDVFRAFLSLFDYDPQPLEAVVESRHEEAHDWVREAVSYTAAYGGERITAQLFLPTGTTRPYQAVLYFPGSGAIPAGPTDRLEERTEFRSNIAFLLKTGRAVLYPAYRGTHERRHDIPQRLHWSLDPTHEFSEFQVKIIKDVQRSVDYLESRTDIDADRIAYVGYSWGGNMANLALAVDGRFKAAVLNVGGLPAYGKPRPEVDYLNYAPRVTIPVLMLNGRYDLAQVYETEVQPMFELLGTSPEHKRLIVYETDHWIDRREVAKETLAWLDRHLGPVGSPTVE